jgi:hypothetical protein
MLEAWPNPFNDRVTIRQTASKAGEFELAVVDVLGRRVASLLMRASQAGETCSVGWDGRSLEGEPLPSGVYYVTDPELMMAPMQLVLLR